jgi:tetraacyldisaccharide 4'-kinase
LILRTASLLYGTAAAWRRRWYAGNPVRRRKLRRPVISVGNLSVGGSGKTPLVAALAQILLDHGERPAVLTRGYARAAPAGGVTVVSDGHRIVTDLAASGDEALMLARRLPSVPVLVGADRYASGRMAEEALGATVHLLDDGFQHLRLARTVDLVAVNVEDLSDRVLPAGRLREQLTAAAAADAVLVAAQPGGPGGPGGIDEFYRSLGVSTIFQYGRALGPPRWLTAASGAGPPSDARVFAVAGIARPHRFFADLSAAGWSIAGTLTFRDHHRFDPADLRRIGEAARAAGAEAVVTTEKDGVRLEPLLAGERIAVVPLILTLEPAVAPWLLARLAAQ